MCLQIIYWGRSAIENCRKDRKTERVKRKNQKLKEGLIEGWPQSALRGKLVSVKLTFNFFLPRQESGSYRFLHLHSLSQVTTSWARYLVERVPRFFFPVTYDIGEIEDSLPKKNLMHLFSEPRRLGACWELLRKQTHINKQTANKYRKNMRRSGCGIHTVSCKFLCFFSIIWLTGRCRCTAGCEPAELHEVLGVQLFCFWSSVVFSDALRTTVLSTTAFFNFSHQWRSVFKVALQKPKAKDMKEGQRCPLGPPSCNFV